MYNIYNMHILYSDIPYGILSGILFGILSDMDIHSDILLRSELGPAPLLSAETLSRWGTIHLSACFFESCSNRVVPIQHKRSTSFF